LAEITTWDAHYLLTQWAIWSRPGGNAHPLGRTKGGESPAISDDEALVIDGLVARLTLDKAAIGEAVQVYYFHGCNLALTCNKLKIGYKRADVMVKSGVAWIDGALNSKTEEFRGAG